MNTELSSILKACQKQDRYSQKRLYQEFYSYGMSIAIRYINDEGEAEMIVHDGFLKVYNNLQKFDMSKPFKPWFRQIIVNTSIDYLKKQKRLIMKSNLSEAENTADRENILSNISYKELLTMVHTLSSAYKTVFNMYVIDGFKHEEIAKTLGISVGTSKSNLNKARTKLKALINEQLVAIDNG